MCKFHWIWEKFYVLIDSEKGSNYLMQLNIDLTADRSLKTSFSCSITFTIFFKITMLFFFFGIWNLLTLSRNPKLTIFVLKTSAGNNCVQLFWNYRFCSHFHLVIAVKDLPAVMWKRLCFCIWLLSNRPDIYCQTNKTKASSATWRPNFIVIELLNRVIIAESQVCALQC